MQDASTSPSLPRNCPAANGGMQWACGLMMVMSRQSGDAVHLGAPASSLTLATGEQAEAVRQHRQRQASRATSDEAHNRTCQENTTPVVFVVFDSRAAFCSVLPDLTLGAMKTSEARHVVFGKPDIPMDVHGELAKLAGACGLTVFLFHLEESKLLLRSPRRPATKPGEEILLAEAHVSKRVADLAVDVGFRRDIKRVKH